MSLYFLRSPCCLFLAWCSSVVPVVPLDQDDGKKMLSACAQMEADAAAQQWQQCFSSIVKSETQRERGEIGIAFKIKLKKDEPTDGQEINWIVYVQNTMDTQTLLPKLYKCVDKRSHNYFWNCLIQYHFTNCCSDLVTSTDRKFKSTLLLSNAIPVKQYIEICIAILIWYYKIRDRYWV